MQRYFLDSDYFDKEMIHADKTMLHHMKNVMRYHNDDNVIVIHDSHTYLCKITDIQNGHLEIIEELDENNELENKVTLIYGLPKGDRFEYVLQKATELGVYKIVPFLSKRCVVKNPVERLHKKHVRYTKIIQEAAEQSHRNVLPILSNPITIHDMKDNLSNINIVAYEDLSLSDHKSLRECLSQEGDITIIVGPEGGFEESEITFMKDLGCIPVGLGKRILRTETAPMYLLSVISYERELNQ